MLLCLGLETRDHLSSASRLERADNGDIRVVAVGVDQNILQILFGKEFRHRFRKHRFTRSRSSYHHDMASLGCRLSDDLNGMLLSDYLIDKPFRYLDVGGCLYLIQIDIVKLHERFARAVISAVACGHRRAHVSYGYDRAVISLRRFGYLILGHLMLAYLIFPCFGCFRRFGYILLRIGYGLRHCLPRFVAG